MNLIIKPNHYPDLYAISPDEKWTVTRGPMCRSRMKRVYIVRYFHVHARYTQWIIEAANIFEMCEKLIMTKPSVFSVTLLDEDGNATHTVSRQIGLDLEVAA